MGSCEGIINAQEENKGYKRENKWDLIKYLKWIEKKLIKRKVWINIEEENDKDGDKS